MAGSDLDKILSNFLAEAGELPALGPWPFCFPRPISPLSPELAAILERMQSPSERVAIEKAFHATPDELADAAVAAAKRRRG